MGNLIMIGIGSFMIYKSIVKMTNNNVSLGAWMQLLIGISFILKLRLLRFAGNIIGLIIFIAIISLILTYNRVNKYNKDNYKNNTSKNYQSNHTESNKTETPEVKTEEVVQKEEIIKVEETAEVVTTDEKVTTEAVVGTEEKKSTEAVAPAEEVAPTEEKVQTEKLLQTDEEEVVKNEEPEVAEEKSSTLKNDEFNLTGAYHWTFYLGFIKQKSTHIFAKDYIDYSMRGIAHSTDYRIEKISYDDGNKKWIGKSEDGTFYVLFFKDITDEAVTIYKHKCTEDMKEAVAFARPTDDETKDHGWNIYVHEGVAEQEDILPFAGKYYNAEQQLTIDIKDAQATYQNKTYTKLSHHTGEKRWVGQLGDEFLVIFYQQSKSDDYRELSLAIETFDDEEKAYKVKHDEQTFVPFVKKPIAKTIHVQVTPN